MSVLVIGNATVDETYAVSTLPQPGESVVGELRLRDAGGKALNQAVVMARCGIRTELVAAIGDDDRARWLQQQLASEPLHTSLQQRPYSASDVSLIYRTDDGDNAIVTTVSTTRQLTQAHWFAALNRQTQGGNIVLQGNLCREQTLNIMREARHRQLHVILNPSPLTSWMTEAMSLATLLVLNTVEATGLLGQATADANNPTRIVNALLEASACEQILLTLGSAGAVLATATQDHGASIVSVPAVTGPLVDTTGAGDTFLAVAFASALLNRSGSLDSRALKHAASAASLTIAQHGTLTAFPSQPELASILSR